MTPVSTVPLIIPSPLLIANSPDQTIALGALDVECIVDKAARKTIQVSVTQTFLPSQRVVLTYAGEPLSNSLIGNLDDMSLYWPGEDKAFVSQGSQRSQAIGNTHTFTAVWEVSSLDLHPADSGSKLIKMIAHVLSFPDFISKEAILVDAGDGNLVRSNSQTLIADGWRIILSGHHRTKEFTKYLDDGSAFSVTHVLSIEREDGASFTVNGADEIIDQFYHYLSFCVGRRIGIGAEIGVGPNRASRFLRYGFTNSSRWCKVSVHHWWDTQFGMIDLNGAFAGFCALRQHPVWKDHLTSILYWYLEANQLDRGTIATDTGIVLAQMALEKLAWVYLVHDRRAFTERDFDKIAASGKIRAAAAMFGIPLEIPQDIAERITMGATAMQDIPHLITEVRNDIVHPKQRSAVQIEPYHVWNLAQWYIELMLLRLCGYNGSYNNRAMIKTWRTAPGLVPWTAPQVGPTAPPASLSSPAGGGSTP